MTFGEKLRELRVEKGISQRDLAAAADIDFTYLSKVENGRMPPPAQATIVKLAHALDADSDQLLQMAGKIPTDLGQVIAKTPEMPAFLRSLNELSPEDIKQVTSFAEELKQQRRDEENDKRQRE